MANTHVYEIYFQICTVNIIINAVFTVDLFIYPANYLVRVVMDDIYTFARPPIYVMWNYALTWLTIKGMSLNVRIVWCMVKGDRLYVLVIWYDQRSSATHKQTKTCETMHVECFIYCFILFYSFFWWGVGGGGGYTFITSPLKETQPWNIRANTVLN